MKQCRGCGEFKDELLFRGSSNLCRQCSTQSAVAKILSKRDDRPYGQYKGDVVTCATCGNQFTIKRTVKHTRTVCSLKCRRPDQAIISKGLASMKNLTPEQKELRAKKSSEKLTGRAGRGRAAKGTRNHKAKFYELIGPDRKLYEFKNMADFVRKNSHLFTEDELKPMGKEIYAVIALRGLFAIKKNGERKIQFWHGWTIGDKSEKSLKKLKRMRTEDGKYKGNPSSSLHAG